MTLRSQAIVVMLAALLIAGAGGRAQAQAAYATQAPSKKAQDWQRFVGAVGGEWKALWDGPSQMPIRVYGTGIAVPGSSASADEALRATQELLEEHLYLFAPDSKLADFKVVSNVLTPRGMRVVGLRQFYRGLPIVDAQFSVRIVDDRIIVIAAETRSGMQASLPRTALSEAACAQAAQRSLPMPTRVKEVESLALLIAQGSTSFIRRVYVEEQRGGRAYLVDVDVDSGAIVGTRPLHEEGSVELQAHAPVRSWSLGYASFDLPPAEVTINGQTQMSSLGALAFAGASVQASIALRGPHAQVINESGSNYSAQFNLEDGASLLWDASSDEFSDAQLSAFVHVQAAKDFARRVEPGLAWLDEQMSLFVNEDDTCNAYSNHNELHFYRSGGGCGNTARIPDIVYHEFGHSLYHALRIEGVGLWTRSFTEGLADFYAVSMTGDPAWGYGFRSTNNPARHCDPDGIEKHWPEDVGTYYDDGSIYCGAMYDLRKSLITALGEETGISTTNQLFFDSSRTLRDIPTTYVELLAADDDDGNLANGTPHGCQIQTAFARHGLADPDFRFGVSMSEPELAEDLRFSALLPMSCSPGDQPTQLTLHWRIIGPGQSEISGEGSLPMLIEGEQASVSIPRPSWGALVEYQLQVVTGEQATLLPATTGSPFYQYFVGTASPLYCSDFESSEAFANWTHSASSGDDSWGLGAPTGASLDPRQAYSGTQVAGTAIGPSDALGAYGLLVDTELVSPAIDISAYSNVHLQYRRWLSVEDAYYDQATIYAGDTALWHNAAGDGSNHHFDREWRFHDIDLSALANENDTVQVRFRLQSDGAKVFGGWSIDDFCVIGYELPVCGDGVVAGFEECDDGNTDEQDECLSSCLLRAVDSEAGGCGCSAGSASPEERAGTLLLLGLCALLVRKRRVRP